MSESSLAEANRLARLHMLGILDSEGDKYFRVLAERALALLPGTSIAAVTLIDADRQWFKAIVGLDAKEMPRALTFCTHTIQSGGALVVQDAASDARFADNPFVAGQPGIRFYVGIPLLDAVGTLCVIGMQPRRVSEAELAELAKLVQFADIQLLAHGALHQLRRSTT